MKTINYLLLLFMSLMKQAFCDGAKKNIPLWCWTRPNIDAKVKDGIFGINWAVCEV